MKYTYHREVPHHTLCCPQHTTDILTLLHESDTLAPCHVAQKIPRKERYPVSNVTRLAFVGAIHETRFELGTQGAKVVVHDRFDLQCILEAVELLDRANGPRVNVVTACAEDVLDDMAVLHGIVDRLRSVSNLS